MEARVSSSKLLTRQEAAEYLGVKRQTLANMGRAWASVGE